MNIHNYFYNEDTTILSVDFSTVADGDDFYRNLSLTIDEVNYYSPDFISEDDLMDIEDFILVDIVENYCQRRDLPEQILL